MTPLTLPGRVRADILNAALAAGRNGAHIPSALSLVEIALAVLKGMDRMDLFILSKGHGSLGYYAAMHQLGMITDEQFASFEGDGGDFPGHPTREPGNGVACSTGSLGMGLSYGVGAALAKQKRGESGRVRVLLGDGELNEGSCWEAAGLAGRLGLENLTAVVDDNKMQSDGRCEDITRADLGALWAAHGWTVVSCDGHSMEALEGVLEAPHPSAPLAVLARTVKGKGVSFMENSTAWHHQMLKETDYQKAMEEIGDRYGLRQE